MAGDIQPETLTQASTEVDISLNQNQLDPQRHTRIIEFTVPDDLEWVEYDALRDPVRFVPRTMETVTGDGATSTYGVDANLQPIAGEEKLEDQDYPVVVAVDVSTGDEIDIDSVDYAANEVTLASTPADGDDVKLYPIMTDGYLKVEGFNQFDQPQGTLFPWGFPLFRFHDMEQNRRGREINLQGAVRWERHETLAFKIDAPRQIVWEDEDYPESYVSTFEVDTRIGL
ncbi:hypothetical protein [Natrinema longum]|uniref:Uncharacterized protein n=1 Tax=Natrinema longum TaxID=370324 RepID=A0A8A2UC26_9EURY|nr:hypothetical protein [Natrinema longum]MBZ6496018.1 hypothetical protein [Natrinema longum]QSW86052.1 hypothetical protein J0X27_04250 [Natrinema longum]